MWWRRPVVVCAALVCAGVPGSVAHAEHEPEGQIEFVVVGSGTVRDLTPAEEEDLTGSGPVQGRTAASLVGSQDLSFVVDRIRRDFPDDFSDAAVESGVGYEAWISFVGPAPVGVIELLQHLPIDVQVREGVALTEVQRSRAVEVAFDEVDRVFGLVDAAGHVDSQGVLRMTLQDDRPGVTPSAVAALVARAVEADLGSAVAAVVQVHVDVQSEPVVVPETVSGAFSGSPGKP